MFFYYCGSFIDTNESCENSCLEKVRKRMIIPNVLRVCVIFIIHTIFLPLIFARLSVTTVSRLSGCLRRPLDYNTFISFSSVLPPAHVFVPLFPTEHAHYCFPEFHFTHARGTGIARVYVRTRYTYTHVYMYMYIKYLPPGRRRRRRNSSSSRK